MTSKLQAVAQTACKEIGVLFRSVPVDGCFHYLDAEEKASHNGAGRIKLFTDGSGGMVWNHTKDDGYRLFWANDDQTLTPSEMADRKQRAKEERDRGEQELTRARQRAAKLAQEVWKSAQPPTGNPYLLRKKVEPTETLRQIKLDLLVKIIGYHPKVKGEPITGEMVLIVPVKSDKGISTVEMIDEAGRKPSLADGQKKGCFWATGKLPDEDSASLEIGIGEGIATMLTYHQATGCIGIATLTCTNLTAVAQLFRGRYPNAKIIIISDVGNGEQAAIEAARDTNSLIVKPSLPEGSTGSDINDLYTESGLEVVRACIEAVGISSPAPGIENPSQTESVSTINPFDAEIQRLSALSSVQYDKIRKTEAKMLGVRLGTLDAAVKHARKRSDNDSLPMTALFPGLVDLVEDDGVTVFLIKDASGLRVETQVDLDGVQYVPPSKEYLPFLLPRAEQCLTHYQAEDPSLFNDLLAYFQRFSFLPADQWNIIGICTLATYLQDHADIHYQAMILFHAVPERGKSRTGKAITNVAYRGVHLVDMRETNIFRYSGNLGATIFFDIMDLWKKAERNGSEDVMLLRYEKGAKVSRVLYPEKGAFQDTVHYSISGPTIMASNAEVHKILGSRCLTFAMPNAPGNYENPTPELALDIKERLVAWRGKMMDTPLPDILPIDGISGRLWDITKPLFQICRIACPERFEALVDTVLDIAGQRVQEKQESFDGLLVQVIFEMTQGDADHFAIPTADVTTRFNELWNGDKPKRTEWTGRRLKALGIPTDTKNRFSMIRLDREALDTLLMQYGFILQEGEKTSKTSNTSNDTENKDNSTFEDLFEDNITQKNLERTLNTVRSVNTSSCNDVEDTPGVLAKVAEKKSLREVRI